MISVIVISYNHERFIYERLRSIVSQNQTLIKEIFVYDDGSTDNTREIIEQFPWNGLSPKIIQQKFPDAPFGAWTEIIKMTSERLVWIAEGDDSCSPYFLEKMLPCFNDPSVVLAYSDSKIIDENGNTVCESEGWSKAVNPVHWAKSFKSDGAKEWENFWMYRNSAVNASGIIFRKSAFSGLGFYPLGWKACGDWLIWGQLIQQGKVEYINEPLNAWRQHANTTRSTEYVKDRLRLKETLKVINLWKKRAKQKNIPLIWKNYTWVIEWWLSRFSYKNIRKSSYIFVGFPWPMAVIFYSRLFSRTVKEIYHSIKKRFGS